MRLFRKASKAEPVPEAGLPNDPAALAERARYEQAYGINNDTKLDGLGLMKASMIYRQQPSAHHLKTIGQQYSMLHLDVLVLLYYLANHAVGNILEIGPYIGGSTIASAEGMRDSGRVSKFVTIEQGGQMAHPTLPTENILADLRRNLASNGVADLVQVIEGDALSPQTNESVRHHLGVESVDLLVMDADGSVGPALDVYRDLLRDRCWVVIDDYYAAKPIAMEKAERTKRYVDSLVATGELEALGFYGWCTWVGRWHRRA